MYLAAEGIIGAGKSTFCRSLARVNGWRLLEEPVEGNKLLPLFYEDPKRWAFTLQIAMLHNRYRMQQVAAHDPSVCILDRSLPGDRVFARLHTRLGNMDPREWDTYEDCYDAMCAVRPPMLMVFLEVDPEVAMRRVNRRARGMESGIQLQYLRDLADGYEELIRDSETGNHHWSRGIRVVRLSWNEEHADPEGAALRAAPELAERLREAGRR